MVAKIKPSIKKKIASKKKIICPICEKDDVIQKVSAVVEGGENIGSYSGPSGGVSYSDGKWGALGGMTYLSGSSKSKLAISLSLYKREDDRKGPGCIASLIMAFIVLFIGGLLLQIILGLGLVFVINNKINTILGITTLIIVAVIPIILYVIYRVNKHNRAEQKRIEEDAYYQKARGVWAILYYCHRDGIAFDPRNNYVIKKEEIRDYCYENG